MPAVTVPVCENAGFRCASARALVSGRMQPSASTLPRLDGDRHDFVLEVAGLRGRGRPLLTANGEGLLFVAADVPSAGDILGRVAHADIGAGHLGLQRADWASG